MPHAAFRHLQYGHFCVLQAMESCIFVFRASNLHGLVVYVYKD